MNRLLLVVLTCLSLTACSLSVSTDDLSDILTGGAKPSDTDSPTDPEQNNPPDTDPSTPQDNPPDTPPPGDPETPDPLTLALRTGDASAISTRALADAAIGFHQAVVDNGRAAIESMIEPQHPISWDTTVDSALLSPTPGENVAILTANDSGSGATDFKPLAIAGKHNNTHYLVMGGNPIRNAYQNSDWVNDAMQKWIENSLVWLTNKPLSQLDTVVAAQLDQSYYFPDKKALSQWFSNYASQVTLLGDGNCEADALANCLNGSKKPDLLIISQFSTENTDIKLLTKTVKQAMDDGIPVLYLHHQWDLKPLGESLFNLFHVSYVQSNFWSKQKITNLSQADALMALSSSTASFDKFINALEKDLWSFNLTSCDNNCSNQPAYHNEFAAYAEQIRTRLMQYDAQAIRLFDEDGYNVDKVLILLADKYRAFWNFPLDKKTTARKTFMQTRFADYAQYQRRTFIPVPANLGNFSRTEFPDVVTTHKTITRTSRQPFLSAGVYALPGQTVKVTRTDNNPVTTRIFVNTIRDGATHVWDDNGYKRPEFLRGQELTLPAQSSLSFTSTVGGPIQIAFDANDEAVSINFENIGLHPYWHGPEDDASFAQGLNAGLFDWAELATPAFEVHSTLTRMRESAANPNWPTAAALATATMRYTFNYPHILAGYQGEGIDRVDEIIGFAENKGWTVSTVDKVKHINAYQAL